MSSGYISIQRSLRESELYRKSSASQREVLLELIGRVSYESSLIHFDGKRRHLIIGQIWVSQTRMAADLYWAGVTKNHVRNLLDKMVKCGFLKMVATSRTSGSIYECLQLFYAEIAMPFDTRKLTNEKRTTDEQEANEKRTIDEPISLKDNELDDALTNEKRTIDAPLTNEKRTIDDIKYIIHNTEEINNNNHYQKKIFEKNSEAEIVIPHYEYEDPLEKYFASAENFKFWGDKYPLLDMSSEFLKIKKALQNKSANGDAQMRLPFSYVRTCLENAEKERQQRVKAQKAGAQKKGSEKNKTTYNPEKVFAAAEKLKNLGY